MLFPYCRSLRRHEHSSEKVNRCMILAPLVGIILNLLDASVEVECSEQNDLVGVFASMDCPDMVLCRFQYLLKYNWAGSLRGDAYYGKFGQLENFLRLLVSRAEQQESEKSQGQEEEEEDDTTCCICYTSEANARFAPCSHTSCYGCITRHLLNCQRCFFCNATVVEVVRMDDHTA